jgi:Guanine nucleotide exchange factor in Golgi transport N-terminal
VEGSKPRYIRFVPTSEQLLLELIESVFTGHANLINKHREQAHLVRAILIPYLIKVFSEKNSFSLTVRATRLLYLIVKHHLELFQPECETILEWFNHSLDPETTVAWKRVLCLEVYREIYTDPLLVVRIHGKFDGKDDHKAIIPDCLASFVRLASEKPGLIGLGQYSTVPIGNYFQREISADQEEHTQPATIASAGVATNAVPGISVQWSSVRTPCIEQLDKQEPPPVPETYAYSLVLSGLNNLAESLSKFIQQMTITGREKQKKLHKRTTDEGSTASDAEDNRSRRPTATRRRTGSYRRGTGTSTLSMDDHPAVKDIGAATSLIDQSWPAILASCSTFFNASLDAENYRSLVRSFQKFTQVAGLLHMAVPRDAFLTSLGKSAMPQFPITAVLSSATSQPPQTPTFLGNAKGLLSVENIVNQASTFLPERRRNSIDSGEPTLNVRHLLCLRALLNIAIALGPTLDNAWRIVLETLQQADRVLATSGRTIRELKILSQQSPNPSGDGSATQQLASEVAAVQAAASRLFESTAEFPDSAFVYVLRALCGLVDTRNVKPLPPSAGLPPNPGHKPRIASFSGLSVKTGVQENDYVFTLIKIRELGQLNLERFVLGEDDESNGWNLMLSELISIATTPEVPNNSRLLAASIISQLVLDSISFPLEDDESLRATVQSRALAPLQSISGVFNRQSMVNDEQLNDAAVEAHEIILGTLRSLLEQIGEGLISGWQAVFAVIESAFVSSKPELDDEIPKHESELISVKLGRSAFASLQLVCSDFMTEKLSSSMGTLIEILHHFASQDQDLNMSLTVCIILSDFF